jgi:cob(I)alamin adenosyltransferase
MAIYTRTGDKGKTSLFGGSRVLKSDIRVEAYGTIDELNSMLGFKIVFLDKKSVMTLKQELEHIQQDLFAIGSALATPGANSVNGLDLRIKEFEMLIDALTDQLPQLQNFILPGGGEAGSLLHIARTITRRAERCIVALMQQEEVDSGILMYFNRLSDLLFTMARYANNLEKKKETIWKGNTR